MYSRGSVVVPVIVPAQLSVAVGDSETVIEHSPDNIGSVSASATGAVSSLMITV